MALTPAEILAEARWHIGPLSADSNLRSPLGRERIHDFGDTGSIIYDLTDALASVLAHRDHRWCVYRLALEAAADRLLLTAAEAGFLVRCCARRTLGPADLGRNLRGWAQDAIRAGDRPPHDDLLRELRELPTPLTAALEVWASECTPENYDEHVAMVVRS
jgi:hypothetical protein